MTTIRWNEGWRWDSGVTWGGNAPATPADSVRYRVLCDFDRDGFFHDSIASTDALNKLPHPVWWRFDTSGITGKETITLLDQPTPYGQYILRTRLNTTGITAGVYIGRDSAGVYDDFEVENRTDYVLSFWVRGVAFHGGLTFNIAVMSAGDVQRAGDTFTVTGDWSLIQLPFRGFGANFGLRVSVALATGVEIFDVTGLMLTRNPTQNISLLQHAGYVEDDDGGDAAATVVAEASPHDTHVIRTTATNSGGGINTFFGYNGAGGPRSITVEPNTDYTLTIYAKGNSGYSGHQLSLAVLNQDDEDLGGDATELTGDWQALVATFKTGANDTSIVILSRIESHDAGLSYDIAGFTLVDTHTTPASFNAGDSTNFLDEITPYVISVSYHYGFAEQLDLNVAALFEGMAEPAECTIELDNSNWDFLPEDSGATFYELFGPGMLVKVQAEVDNTTYPMFIGRLKRVALGVNQYGQRRAYLTVQDISYELLDAEYLPELQTNITVDRAIAPIFKKGLVPWPYAGRFWLLGVPGSSELGETTRLYVDTLMHFDTARTTLGYAGDNLDNGMGVSAQGAIRDYVAAEAGGRFFYDARTATYKFHNRAYDVLNRGIAASFTESDFLPEPETMYTYGDGIINALTVSYEPREASDDIVVLWSYDGTITLRPGESRTLTVRYRDPDNPDARVGATNVIPPVYNVDFTARNENGTLVGVGYIGTAIQAYGDRAELTLNNGSARSYDTIIISNLRLRGKAIKAYAQQQAFATDPVSIAAYERRDSPPFYLRAIDDADFAQQVASWYVNRFSRPIARYAYVSFEALQSDTLMGHALRLNVGDHINISHARIGHDKDYVIVGMMQSFRLGSHRVRLALAPLDRTTYWLLGVPGSSELGETTRLFL